MGLDLLNQGCELLNYLRGQVDSTQLSVPPAEISEKLSRYWSRFIEIFQVAIGLTAGASSAGYYLHNYAGYLAGQDSYDDLERSQYYFREFVIPSRRARSRQSQDFAGLRRALQVAAQAAGALATLQQREGDAEGARRTLEQGSAWALEAINNEATDLIIDRGDASVVRLATSALPTIIQLWDLESDHTDLSQRLAPARQLLLAALKYPKLTSVQRSELEDIRARMEELV